MALNAKTLKDLLKAELAIAAEQPEDKVEPIATALANAIVEFLTAAASAGDLDA
jgi:hypothetical protein